MHDLEELVRPFMEPMLEGKRIRLSEQDQRLLATWAVLKVMVVHHRFVHYMQRKQMRKNRSPPKQWYVWIAKYEPNKLGGEWFSHPLTIDILGSRRRPSRRYPVSNSHATTQIVKNILIHVVKFPDDDFASKWKWTDQTGKSFFSGAFLRIWPPTRQSLLWPQKPLTDQDAIVAIEALYRSIRQVGIDQGLMLPDAPKYRL